MNEEEASFWRSVCATVYREHEAKWPPDPKFDDHRAQALKHAGEAADRAVRALRMVRAQFPRFGYSVE